MTTSNYTNYSIPQLLLDTINLQTQLKKEGLLPYGDLLGLYFNIEPIDARYHNNPLDYIPFATTGMDGIGFGFLTDFGQVSTLDQAYIVRTSPMDFDNPVSIVARNLHDFLSLVYIDFDTIFNLDITSTPEEVEQLRQYKLSRLDESESFTEPHKNKVLERYYSVVTCSAINSIANYLSCLKQERLSITVIPTSDTIGIVHFDSINNTQYASVSDAAKSHPPIITINYDTQINLAEAKYYFTYATTYAKLAFIREATSSSLIHSNAEWVAFIVEELLALQLYHESIRLHFPEQYYSTYSPESTTHIALFKD